MAQADFSDTGWSSLTARLAARVDFEASAFEKAALRRRRAIGSASDLLRLCFAFVLGQLSLRMLAGWAGLQGIASLSDVAVLNRLRGSVDWLESILQALVGQLHPDLVAPSPPGALGRGERLCLVDGSMIGAVGTGERAQRLHAVYDLSRNRLQDVDVTGSSCAERLDYGSVRPGDIRVGDRGYARHRDFAAIRAKDADFIVRTGTSSLRMFMADDPTKSPDLAALCEQAKASDAPLEHRVEIHKGGRARDKPAPVMARLIIAPLPQSKIAKAQQRARKAASRWNYKVSAKTLVISQCLVLVTSLPPAQWPLERVISAYRLRWQIELLFKRWKSLIGVAAHRAKDPKLIKCWITTALIIALLIEHDRPDIATDEPGSLPFAPSHSLTGQSRSGDGPLTPS